MTLQEFINKHPSVIQYDRAGVEGIDFEALHLKIEASRYLKSRKSFIFLVKNYSRILAGEFDDFVLEDKPPVDERIEKRKETARMRMANLKECNDRLSDNDIEGLLGKDFRQRILNAIELLKKSIETPAYLTAAFVAYQEIKEDLRCVTNELA